MHAHPCRRVEKSAIFIAKNDGRAGVRPDSGEKVLRNEKTAGGFSSGGGFGS
jgi:hypothetical protein